MVEPTPTPTLMSETAAQFAAENPELMEALEIFGIASAEYERALQALYPIATYTASSTS